MAKIPYDFPIKTTCSTICVLKELGLEAKHFDKNIPVKERLDHTRTVRQFKILVVGDLSVSRYIVQFTLLSKILANDFFLQLAPDL